MSNFFSDFLIRNNFWHIPLTIMGWAGFFSFLIWWNSALLNFIEREIKKRYGTIWFHIVAWRNLCKFFSRPKNGGRKQKIIIGLLISIFLLQHFGYNANAGKNFYRGCEQVKKVLTFQVTLESMYRKSQTSGKKSWWRGPVKLLLNIAKFAGIVQEGADAVEDIKKTGKSVEKLFD